MTEEATTVLFDWIKPTEQHTQGIEYQVESSKYKIYQNTLESIEVKDIIPHCLAVKQKMKSVTSTQKHLDACYFNVMGRTMGTAVQSVWDNLLKEKEKKYTEDEAGLNKAIKDLVEIHAVEEDRYDTVQFLRNSHKPRQVKVMSFYYRLLEINGYVEWLPGTEAALDKSAIKSSFFEAMPAKWKERFAQSGHSRVKITMAQTVRFFHAQEHAATKKQAENEAFQRRNKPKTNSNKSQSKTPFRKSTKTKPKTETKRTKSIADDAKCPIHPDHEHTWGECKSNHYSKKGKELRQQAYERRKAKENTPEGDNHMIQSVTDESNNEDMLIDEAIEMNLDDPEPIIDDILNISKGNIYWTEIVPCECFATTDHGSSVDSNNAVFSSTQSKMADVTVECYMSNVEEKFLLGKENSSLNELSSDNDLLNPKVQQLLRPIGVMLADTIHGSKPNKPFKVLFDPGSDNTFVHGRNLPPGINGRTVKPISVIKRSLSSVVIEGPLPSAAIATATVFPSPI